MPLLTAPFGDATSRYFTAFDRGGIGDVIDVGGGHAIGFVAYQAMGIMAIVAALLLPIAALTALQADVSAQSGSRWVGVCLWLVSHLGNLGIRWRSTMTFATVCAVISWTLCSGAAYDLAASAAGRAARSAPALSDVRATVTGDAVTVWYRLDAPGPVSVTIMSAVHDRVLRRVRFDDDGGSHRHRLRAVARGRSPRRLKLRLGLGGASSARVDVAVRRSSP